VGDFTKYTACLKEGITLIPVPYWWDAKASSMAATILLKRPDVASQLSREIVPENPIPEDKPNS
jgi:hypothetical protein